METYQNLLKEQRKYCLSEGGILGFFGLREADEVYNNLNIQIIKAFKEENGCCFIGKFNFDGQKREDIITGEKSCYEEYTGQKVYNFGCDFIVPEADEKLAQLIKEWNTGRKASLINDIQNRIESV